MKKWQLREIISDGPRPRTKLVLKIDDLNRLREKSPPPLIVSRLLKAAQVTLRKMTEVIALF